ncbi:MAG: hypothetical protein ACM3NW_00345 [Syntrophomonadaceae bacterium]
MVSLSALWLPILVSGVIVFVASSIIHMALTYHRSDCDPLATEEQLLDAMRKAGVPPGDYYLPHAGSMAVMKSPEYQARVEKGPLVVMTVLRGKGTPMGQRLFQWFVFILVVSLFAGYVASRTLGPGTPYRTVFRIVGTVAFAGYALGTWPNSIWWSKKWSTTIKGTFDGLVYALLTAGVFGWLWPR